MNYTSIARQASIATTLIFSLCSSISPHQISAQQHGLRRNTFIGPYDSEFTYPVAEGKIGRKDPSAMTQISEAIAASSLPEGSAIEAKGIVSFGSASTARQLSASLAIEVNGRFRMDVENGDETRSLRFTGGNGQAKRGRGAIENLSEPDFGDPLALPVQLEEVANRNDAVVVDDGVIQIGQQKMNKITITLLHTKTGIPFAASFYFNSATHLLEKSAFVNHGATNNSLAYLKVVTYSDYRTVQSAVLPLDYSETVNGQLLMTLKLTSTNLSSSHDDSYFTFER